LSIFDGGYILCLTLGSVNKRETKELEETMKKEIFQENKARWELFEQIGRLSDKIIWAIVGAAVALVAMYLFSYLFS
jgi:hypothetical protein